MQRCCSEDNISLELMARLAVYPKMKDALQTLPHKMYALRSDAPANTPVAIPIEKELIASIEHVQYALKRIDDAVFLGKGDKSVVRKLYTDYVSQLGDVLMRTLAIGRATGTDARVQEEEVPLPSVDVVAAEPLRLVDGQPLLCVASSGEFKVAFVHGITRVEMLTSGAAELLFDGSSQEVLPWVPPNAGWMQALSHDLRELVGMLPPLVQRAQRLHATVQAAATSNTLDDGALTSLQSETDALARDLVALKMARARGRALEQVAADLSTKYDTYAQIVRKQSEAAASNDLGDQREIYWQKIKEIDPDHTNVDEQAPLKELQRECQRLELAQRQKAHAAVRDALERVRRELNKVHQDGIASEVMRTSGAVGARCYAPGQWITVRDKDGIWCDAQVDACEEGIRHRMLHDGRPVCLDLHPWNHAPRELPHATFETLRRWYLDAMRKQHAHVFDALTGQRLDVMQQCVAIKVTGDSELMAVDDARGLAVWLRDQHTARYDGGACDVPCAALLVAGPAAGKTTLLSQVAALSLDGELLPVFVKVQRLQRLYRNAKKDFASAWNWVDALMCHEYGQGSPLHRMLRQAMMARRTLLLIDGLDEGGSMRGEIEQHVANVLAPQGHVLLATSRPAGVDVAQFVRFRQMQLSPLSDAQQEQALEQRLGKAGMEALRPYLDRIPRDPSTDLRATTNPLMLSMVASVFELRRGVDMPQNISGLYETASEAMLARGGVTSPKMHRLLRHIFFEAHAVQAREIDDAQFYSAALSLTQPQALAKIRKETEPAVMHRDLEVDNYIEVLRGEHAGKRGAVAAVEYKEEDCYDPSELVCCCYGHQWYYDQDCELRFCDPKENCCCCYGIPCCCGAPTHRVKKYKLVLDDGKSETRGLRKSELRLWGLNEHAYNEDQLQHIKRRVERVRNQLAPGPMRDALEEMQHSVSRDELPLLSLLQVEPQKIQSSHLSFQEYYAACAIREGQVSLAGAPPWQWPVWWANVLTLGAEMGDAFGCGLLRAAGVKGDALNIAGRLGGDLTTAARAVAEMSVGLKTLTVDEGAKLNLEQLRGARGETALDLSRKGLGPASGIVIAKCLRTNASLLKLKYAALCFLPTVSAP